MHTLLLSEDMQTLYQCIHPIVKSITKTAEKIQGNENNEGMIRKDEQFQCLDGIKALALKPISLYRFYEFFLQLPHQSAFQGGYTGVMKHFTKLHIFI